MEGEEGQPVVTPNQEKAEDLNFEEDLDFEEYSRRTNKFFESIIRKVNSLNQVVNKIESALVTNITSDLSIVKDLVVEFCSQNYMKFHVEKKVDCMEKEVDGLIQHLNNIRDKKKGEAVKEEIKLMKTSEWLYCISKKTEKIKNLVSQFGSLPDEDEEKEGSASSSTGGGKREKQKTVSNSTECHKMCIEESLLISPMMSASLRKSYDHLPTNELRLCLLTLAAFPEDFIIKKRPLIYWWMAEGFVVATREGEGENNGNSKSAEEVGEENFTQLIQLGLIQPWHECGGGNTDHVQGCRVHPWIRRMLVSIAMEAQLFEFFGIPEHPHPPHPPRSRRVCLYDDAEGDEDSGSWKTKNRKNANFGERLKWIKVKYTGLMKDVGQVENKDLNLKAMSERQKKLKCITDLSTLLTEVTHGKIKPWVDPDDNAFNKRRILLENQIEDMKKTSTKNSGDDMTRPDNNILLKKLHDEQMELLNVIAGFKKQVQDELYYLDRVLDPGWVNDPLVYNRENNCEILQEKEDLLFGHNDLNNPFPSPMKKKKKKDKRATITSTSSNGADEHQNEQAKKSSDEAAERLLAIINVTQKYLDMDHEPFGKMKNLRTLHLGRWRDSLPVPHIEVENARILDALFHVAKHLKYLSLRGISRITALPSTISKCCNLQILDLKACYNLETLPSQIASLYKLTHLDVSECYLLQNPNLWSLVQHLQYLQTLKGLKLDQSTQTSLKTLAAAVTLRKLSIILTTPTFHIHLLTSLSNLRILTITWRITPDPQPKPRDGATTENLPQPQPAAEEISANTETTPQPKPEKSGDDKGIEVLPNLKKLELRCYPDKDWPNWVKKHSSLETLYITGGHLEEFPMSDLHLKKLQLLRFKYLTKLKLSQDNTPQPKSDIFPSLITFNNHNIKSKK